MPPADEVLVVGGGIAGIRTAQGLRNYGYAGNLTVFSEESQLPYDRPPLSKEFLTEAGPVAPAWLLPSEEYARLDIRVELGRRAIALDTRARWVVLEDGETVPYDAAVIATGAAPRALPALESFENVLTLRTATDARQIARELIEGARIAVVGGGFIGQEVASAARARGCEVTVIEKQPTPLAGVLPPEFGRRISEWHESKGVSFRLGAEIERGDGGDRATTLLLDDGDVLGVDAVVVGVGVDPATSWLRGSTDVLVDQGVLCDLFGRTSVPWVYAVGDVAQRSSNGRSVLNGHWTAATEQARRTAGAMVGRLSTTPAHGDTYFWSDQHGSRLQYVGAFPPDGEVTIEHGSLEQFAFVAVCRVASRVAGVFAVDAPAEFTRRRIELGRLG